MHHYQVAVSKSLDNKTGILTITTKDWDATTTQKQEFNVDGTIVSAYFGVSRGISTK